MDKQSLPIIAENQNTLNTPNLDRELFTLLVKELPEAQHAIHEAYKNKAWQAISDHIHKLQGTCVYCGLSRLNFSVTELNQAIKQKKPNLDGFLQDFNQEVELVMKELKHRGYV